LHTAEAQQNLVPGKWTKVRIELFPFTHVFRQDSSIRLAISGPGGAVNAWPWAFDAIPGGFDVLIAHGNVITEDSELTSSVVLPVVQPTDLSLPSSLPDCDGVALQPCRKVD
jgi:hypothetical protein